MTSLLLVLVCASSSSDGDDAAKKVLTAAERKAITERVCAAARKAAAEDDVARTEFIPVTGQTPFEELNKLGTVLIGFRLGVSQIADRMLIHALEPIYMTARTEIYGAKRGRERPPVAKRAKSSAVETEILRAKPGYAVGAIRVHLGVTLEGLKVVFMRIKGDRLDPNDSYESKWVGVVAGDRPRVIDGGGHLAVGIRGVEAGKDLLQIGLVFAGKDASANAVVESAFAGKSKAPNAAGTKNSKGPPDGLFKKMDSSEAATSKLKKSDDDAREPTSIERPKEPKTADISLTIQQPLWKWEERFRRARVGDFAQYDFPDEHITRIQEIVEVGERFVVVRERIMPTNNQRMILMKFDDSNSRRPPLPEPEEIKVKIGGKNLACKRYIYPASGGGKEMQEVYSDEVPFEGLVGRQSDKGSIHLRRFSRGRS